MAQLLPSLAALFLILALFIALMRKIRSRTHRPGAGATGAVHEMLIEDRRKAIEIILEERAEARDPEDKDGDLPQLERPKRR